MGTRSRARIRPAPSRGYRVSRGADLLRLHAARRLPDTVVDVESLVAGIGDLPTATTGGFRHREFRDDPARHLDLERERNSERARDRERDRDRHGESHNLGGRRPRRRERRPLQLQLALEAVDLGSEIGGGPAVEVRDRGVVEAADPTLAADRRGLGVAPFQAGREFEVELVVLGFELDLECPAVALKGDFDLPRCRGLVADVLETAAAEIPGDDDVGHAGLGRELFVGDIEVVPGDVVIPRDLAVLDHVRERRFVDSQDELAPFLDDLVHDPEARAGDHYRLPRPYVAEVGAPFEAELARGRIRRDEAVLDHPRLEDGDVRLCGDVEVGGEAGLCWGIGAGPSAGGSQRHHAHQREAAITTRGTSSSERAVGWYISRARRRGRPTRVASHAGVGNEAVTSRRSSPLVTSDHSNSGSAPAGALARREWRLTRELATRP